MSYVQTIGNATIITDSEPVAVQSVKKYTHLEFLLLLTLTERTALRTSTDPVVQDFLYLAEKAEYIDLTFPQTAAGMNYLVTANILTPERLTEIMG